MTQKNISYGDSIGYYFDIPLNKDINQSLLNINNKIRSNKFSWTGQFSPQFIEILIKKYSNTGDTVFDPFSGSGTVIAESVHQGRSAISIELNPAAFYMSDFYRILFLDNAEKTSIVNKIDEYLSNGTPYNSIRCLLRSSNKNISSLGGLLTILLNIHDDNIDGLLLTKKWSELKFDLLTTTHTQRITTYLGDARTIKISQGIADITITSPPYINVLNYHQQYRKSMEFIDWNILGIAKNEVGSNRKNRGNRFFSIQDYVMDMASVIINTIYATKKGGRIIFVVGHESTVLGEKFYNGEIIFKIFNALNHKLIIKQSRTFKNRFGKLITEDILHFKSNNSNISIESVKLSLTNIVIDTLHDHILTVNAEKAILLNNAIERAQKI